MHSGVQSIKSRVAPILCLPAPLGSMMHSDSSLQTPARQVQQSGGQQSTFGGIDLG
jgi:hypothetical protein